MSIFVHSYLAFVVPALWELSLISFCCSVFYMTSFHSPYYVLMFLIMETCFRATDIHIAGVTYKKLVRLQSVDKCVKEVIFWL